MTPQTIIDLFDEAVKRKSRPDALRVKRGRTFRLCLRKKSAARSRAWLQD